MHPNLNDVPQRQKREIKALFIKVDL